MESRDVLLRLLRELIESEGIPLLLVTHDPATAFALASDVLVLEAGRVRFQGEVSALPRAPLDRFMARFLGFENLFTRSALRDAGESALARILVQGAGSGGVVVPDEAIAWTSATGPNLAQITSVRWAPRGWMLTLRQDALTFAVHSATESLRLRVGDTVQLEIDATCLRPLTEEGAS